LAGRCSVSKLRKAVRHYLALRRGLGFKMYRTGRWLPDFVSFLEKRGVSRITNDLAVQWATLPRGVQPVYWASRLCTVRLFALHWSATDPKTEVPPPDLLPYRVNRRTPYLYSPRQVTLLLRAASRLEPAMKLRQWTYPTLLGLLSVTGLRISEALALDRDAVDLAQGLLTIRGTKFGKSRLVPLHSSTRSALGRYAKRRDEVFSTLKTPAFFVSNRGTRLSWWAVRWTFIKLSCQVGLRKPSDSHGPRLHDFRHGFAVGTLLRWYRARLDVDRMMPLLSTYLGHSHTADTYWYLSATPELLSLAGARLEKTLGGLP
jgi:integrase/recombinase XerD